MAFVKEVILFSTYKSVLGMRSREAAKLVLLRGSHPPPLSLCFTISTNPVLYVGTYIWAQLESESSRATSAPRAVFLGVYYSCRRSPAWLWGSAFLPGLQQRVGSARACRHRVFVRHLLFQMAPLVEGGPRGTAWEASRCWIRCHPTALRCLIANF